MWAFSLQHSVALGNVSSLSMWLGQQRSCIFDNTDILPMFFTALLLVLILQLPKLGICHRSHKHMCLHMSGRKRERTWAMHGFCPGKDWRLGRTYTQARKLSNIPRFFSLQIALVTSFKSVCKEGSQIYLTLSLSRTHSVANQLFTSHRLH